MVNGVQALPCGGVEVAQAPPGGRDGGGRLLRQQPLLTRITSPRHTRQPPHTWQPPHTRQPQNPLKPLNTPL
jgi:hypothetical protein